MARFKNRKNAAAEAEPVQAAPSAQEPEHAMEKDDVSVEEVFSIPDAVK